MLADEELGLVATDMADEMQQAEATRLQERGMGANHLGQLVAPRVLQGADRDDLVVDRIDVAKVRLADRERAVEPPTSDLVAQPGDLLGGGVDADTARTRGLLGVKHEAAEAATDVDEAI